MARDRIDGAGYGDRPAGKHFAPNPATPRREAPRTEAAEPDGRFAPAPDGHAAWRGSAGAGSPAGVDGPASVGGPASAGDTLSFIAVDAAAPASPSRSRRGDAGRLHPSYARQAGTSADGPAAAADARPAGSPPSRPSADAYIAFDGVVRTFGSGGARINALDGATFEVRRGELAIILGASGAGKTTALNILGGMDRATAGRVVIDGGDITNASDADLVEYRRSSVGFVFQFYNLVPNLTALENVEMATQVCKDAFDPAETLAKVGLFERMGNFPAQLSGGEQQRVSIARAVAKNPKLLLCDEPTGALDYKTGKQILKLLQDLCHDEGITVVIVTHNSALAPMADRLIRFASGKVVEMTVNPEPVPVEEIEW